MECFSESPRRRMAEAGVELSQKVPNNGDVPGRSLDELLDLWEKKLGLMETHEATLDAFLDLAAFDMRSAAANIDCPFCRRHMRLEADEIAHVLGRIRADGDRPHKHGIEERMKTLARSFEIVANVLLGGLRRAGVV